VWRLVDGGAREELTLAGRDTGNGVRGVALSPDSQQLLTGDVDVTAAVIWDVSDAGDAEWTNLPVDPELFSPVAFTPDSRNVVVTGPRGVVTMHDAETGAAVVEMPEHRSPYTYIETLDVHRDDGAIAAAVNVEGPNGMAYAARVWDSSGEPSTAVDGDGWIFDVAWHPTDDVLAFATLLGEVHVVDSSGAQLAVLRQEPDTIAAALEFSPDGTLLAAATFRRNRFEGEVELWDWQAERRARRLDVFAQGIAFSPDGRHVATAEITGRARVWDVRTRQPVTTLEQQSGMLFTVSYSPDGRTIATAGADRTIRLWGTSTGTERLRLAGHEAPIGSLAFSRDGTKLASGGQDGLARVWALDLDDLVAIAEGELTRDLTTAECRQFLHTDECPRR
jgi:WD40 repeat protein